MRWRRVVVATVPGVLAGAVFLAVFLAVRDRLPADLATHMAPDGRADDFQGQGTFLVVGLLFPALLAVAFGLMTWFSHGQGAAPRGLAAVGAGTIALVGYVLAMTVLTNADATDPEAVRFPAWHLVAAVATGVCAAVAGWFLAGADPDDATTAEQAPPAGADRLALAAREQVAWTRTVNSPGLWATGGATMATTALLGLLVGWWTAVPALVVALVTTAGARVRVSADARGLTVASTLLPKPRVRVPLDRIAAADTRSVSALRDFGGWGYRVRADARGVILRSGDALAVRQASGAVFCVTVDDAATAAATLNALADRARRDHPNGT